MSLSLASESESSLLATVSEESASIEKEVSEQKKNIPSVEVSPKVSEEPSTSSCLHLVNICTAKDVVDPEELNEIKEDLVEEASKFGRVLSLVIDTTLISSLTNLDVDVPVYLRADSHESASKISVGLSGRRFQGRVVAANFISESEFESKEKKTHSSHYSSAAFAPPKEYAPVTQADQAEIYKVSELPEDNLVLPNVPAVADID